MAHDARHHEAARPAARVAEAVEACDVGGEALVHAHAVAVELELGGIEQGLRRSEAGDRLVESCVLYLLFADVLTPELMMAFYIFFGVGQGFGMSTSMTHGLSCLPEELRTDGSSVFNTLQQLGGSVGVSAVTAVVGAAQAGAVSMEAGTAAGGKMAFMLLTAVIAGAVAANVVAFYAKRRQSGRA